MTTQDKMPDPAKINFFLNLNSCCQTTLFWQQLPSSIQSLAKHNNKKITTAPAGEMIKCFSPFWQTICHYFSSPTVAMPCHGCNFLSFQKPVVGLQTEIIDFCSTSPSLFVIYIFPYSLNTVIVPLSVFVLLLLYTVLLGLAGEIGMIWFRFLITVKAVWSGWVSTKCKVQTFGHTPDQNSVAAWHLTWVLWWLWPGWRAVSLSASLCPGEAPRCGQSGVSSLQDEQEELQDEQEELQGAGMCGAAQPFAAALELLPQA